MKHIYYEQTYYKVGNADWQPINPKFWHLLHYGELPQETEESVNTFQELWNYNCADIFLKEYQLFSKKPVIYFSYNDYAITEKNFQPIKFKNVYKTCDNETLSYYMKNLKANDMIQYLKDNGINMVKI